MSDKNNDDKHTFTRKRRTKKRRTLDPDTLLDLENKQAQQDAKQEGQKLSEEAQRENEAENPTLDRAALVKEYNKTYDALATALTSEAEKKTSYATISAEAENMNARLEVERNKLEQELATEKQQQIGKFMSELKDVQNALGTVVQDVEQIAGDKPEMKGIIQGLGMVADGLSKIFNAHAPSESNAPDVTAREELSANTYEAELPEKQDFDGAHKDMDAVTVNFALSNLKKQLESTSDNCKSLDEKIAEAENRLERIKTSHNDDLERAKRDVEKKKSTLLKKAATDAVAVADNLNMAMKALNAQKANLGDKFNDVSARIANADVEMQDAFAKFGIQKIAVKPGDDFDYNVHNAVNTGDATAEIKADQILEVLTEGYTLNGTTLRDPLVKVAK